MAVQKDTSVLELETRLKKNPASLVFSRLADCYRKRGDIQQAVDLCSRGLSDHPDSITGRIILGRCFLEQEKLTEATQEFSHVIERDHRNQVALKMLADVYARQGMKEKAGDLFAYLSAMDPANETLVNLTRTYVGTGKADVFGILGFSPQSSAASMPDVQAAGGDIFDVGAGQEQSAMIDTAAFAQTMELGAEELLPAVPAAKADEFAQTMKFDSAQLIPPTPYEVEEVVADIGSDGGEVTGDDISSRMSMMFDDDSSASGDNKAVALEEQEQADRPVSDQTGGVEDPAAYGGIPEVSGADVSSRIEQLFSDQTHDTSAQRPVDYTSMFEMTDAPAVHEARQEAVKPAPKPPQSVSTDKIAADADVSGEDVVSRMNEMFEQPGGQAQIQEPSDSFESTGQLLTPETEPPPLVIEAPAKIDQDEQDLISGEDIAQRLESIFDEEPIALRHSDSHEELSFEEPPSTSIFAAEENVADMAEEARVIDNSEFIDSDTLNNAEMAISAGSDKKDSQIETAAEPDFEEPMATILPIEETELPDDSPEMSGNDVAQRLDELFPRSLLGDDSESLAREIPEGDKDEETVNQGFYTMSGDNAETAQSDETLLEKLDDVEFEAPLQGPSEDIFSDAAATGYSRDAAIPLKPLGDRRGGVVDEAMPEVFAGPFVDGGDTAPSGPGKVDDGSGAREYSIPDHVLTPTLADIYFQQGQPHLAVEIYQRLLRRDPDNQRIIRRIADIERHCASIAALPAEAVIKKTEAAAQPIASPKPRTKKTPETPKPLAGVRIKKTVKKKIKER